MRLENPEWILGIIPLVRHGFAVGQDCSIHKILIHFPRAVTRLSEIRPRRRNTHFGEQFVGIVGTFHTDLMRTKQHPRRSRFRPGSYNEVTRFRPRLDLLWMPRLRHEEGWHFTTETRPKDNTKREG